MKQHVFRVVIHEVKPIFCHVSAATRADAVALIMNNELFGAVEYVSRGPEYLDRVEFIDKNGRVVARLRP